MLRPACLLLLVVLAAAAFAAKQPPVTSLTVEQLDHLLAGARGQSDRSLARQLAGLQLTERASSSQLHRWQGQFTGAQTREALLVLADASAFLRLPPSEIAANPAPAEQTLKQLRQRMVDYVKIELPRLPNFVAQRTTTAFAITTEQNLLPTQSIMQIRPGAAHRSSYRGYHEVGPATASRLPDGKLYWMGSFSQSVTYRDGAEVNDASDMSLIEARHLAIGLTTHGEFGSILQLILLDAEPEAILWDHWERTATESLAVFHYSVPRARSHFAEAFSADEPPDYPAYHGEIAMAPSTGEVFRISISANTHDPRSAHSANLLVEFAPTEIGGVPYICPTRGVAILKTFSIYTDLDADPPPISSETSINDVSFTGYHVFRSNSRLLPASPEPASK